MKTRIERGLSLLNDMLTERQRQIDKFGAQLETPSLPTPNLSWMSEEDAKRLCNEAFAKGEGSWAHIALEEFCEAVDAPDEESRRVELIQLATVVMGWIEAIDAKAGRFVDPDPPGLTKGLGWAN